MDLQAYLIIVTVFFASLGFLLFINRQINAGKTFEEVLAEKRQLTEKLYGTNKKKKNTWKKTNKKKHEPKQQKVAHSAVESESTKSDSGDDDGNTSNASSTEQNVKVHVEFTEADFIAPETNTIQFKRQLSASKLPQQPVRKTSSTKSPGSGILLNKATTSPKPAPPTNGSIETLNHFDKIHPKDDLEIKKQRDESVGRHVNNNNNNNNQTKKNGNKNNKKDNSPAAAAPTNTKAVEIAKDAIEAHLTVPSDAIVHAPKESPKNTGNKEKSNNKKKRSDAALVQQLVQAGVASTTSEAVNVNAIIQQLGRTELSRSEIQLLIDFLLNKQQDTANVQHADWSDDPIHKLRKQIEEKDRLLSEEQASTLAIQAKLRELRAELNAERQQSHQRLAARTEEINKLQTELNQLMQEQQLLTERTATEKQNLTVQLHNLQQQLYQEKQKVTKSQENAQQYQQLTDTNAQLTAELLTKNNIIQDMNNKFLQLHDENNLHKKTINDYEQKFQEFVRQNETDTAHLNQEIQRLRTECQRKDELEKLYSIKKYEFEQLEARIAEQNKQSNQIEDNSKVEIRNLENALDSTKTELQLARNELAGHASRADELDAKLISVKAALDTETSNAQKYSKQIEELNGTIRNYRSTISEKDQKLSELQSKLDSMSSDQREQELFKQIAEYKEKNNTGAATLSPTKYSTIATNTTSTKESVDQHQQYLSRTKEVFERLFPSIADSSNVDYETWLTNLTNQIEQLQQQQNCLKQTKSNATTNHQQQINGDDEDSADDEGVNGTTTTTTTTQHNYGQDNGIKISPSTEELILQNAQLKSTVDEYKNIVADTEGVLKTLEMKVKEKDAYWRSIVQVKDNEIRSLKQNDLATT